MTGRVLNLQNVISPDMKATRITEKYVEWETLRQQWKVEKEEIRRYVYATDTTFTTNAHLPWKNKTTIPKVCQIRDNLISNYLATMFPKRKWLQWEPTNRDSANFDKAQAITSYISWCIEQPEFKTELTKVIMDYIDFGNCFGTVEWIDRRVQLPDKTQYGFVGPMLRRVNPLNIVFNPTAEDFIASPKIIRSIISMGEVKEMLERLSTDQNRLEYEELYDYLKKIRFHARTFQGENWDQYDRLYAMDGFTSFRAYLLQDFVEILTFYGDWYDDYNDIFEKNRVITVIDRHKLVNDKPNPAFFGYPPIYHTPWRKKQDNLWGMGPLDNLIGMQYRLDHIENAKADITDTTSYPVQKIKGFVEDYVWQPGEKIFIGDEGDVELVQPQINFQNLDMDLVRYKNDMEEMAGAPKEAMGFRSPGEKTAYEVQRLENAASRIFQNKIVQFEEQILEPLLNAMLELGRRQMGEPTQIKVFDDEFQATTFATLTPEDISGIGRIRPISARNFAEKAQMIQNLTNLAGSPLFQLIAPHMSGKKTAEVVEEVLDLKDYNMFMPFVQISEQYEGQMYSATMEQQLHQHIQTPTGMGNDFDLSQGPQANTAGLPKGEGAFDLKRQPPLTATPGGELATQ